MYAGTSLHTAIHVCWYEDTCQALVYMCPQATATHMSSYQHTAIHSEHQSVQRFARQPTSDRHTSAYVRIRQHTSAYASILIHTHTHTHAHTHTHTHTHRTSSLATLRKESSEFSTGSAHRYSVYLLYWFKSTITDTPAASPHTDADSGAYVAKQHGRRFAKDSVYLLYWHKSTNTDAEGAAGSRKNIAEHYDLGNDMY